MTLHQIKNDLSQISIWPHLSPKLDEGELEQQYDTMEKRRFALRIPSRIACLIEYCEAAEAWIKSTERGSEKRGKYWDRLEQARARLVSL